MDSAVCWRCVDDKYLKEIIKSKGEPVECSVCHEAERNAFTVEELGRLIEPILREHLRQGGECGENGENWAEEEGDPLSFWVQEVIGECFGLEDEIVEAVIDAEGADPARDGESGFFDTSCSYVSSSASFHDYDTEWNSVLQELKHSRRFFSTSAQALFDKLFCDVDDLKSWNVKKKRKHSVVSHLPKGTRLYRARVCNSRSLLEDIRREPFRQVGPPPPSLAQAGRMNVEGVVVFYGARDARTCLAEMRPALKGSSVVITLRTTRSLRILDFTRFENSGKELSYFQPDFDAEAEKYAFLRRLHSLISQPVIPGQESDYLITQTMAEYLAHVHKEPFDGISFSSVQRVKGVNVVLFPTPLRSEKPNASIFPLTYVDKSVRLFSTESIRYKHTQKSMMRYDEDDY